MIVNDRSKQKGKTLKFEVQKFGKALNCIIQTIWGQLMDFRWSTLPYDFKFF